MPASCPISSPACWRSHCSCCRKAADVAVAGRRHDRRAAVLMHIFVWPFTYNGGGGPLGNRYFLSFYPLFLFLTPPTAGLGAAATGLMVGALFTSTIVLNPFFASANPGEHAKSGPLRVLPIDLTLINDLARGAAPRTDEAAAWRHAARARVFSRRQRVQPRRRVVLGEREVEGRRRAARAGGRRGPGKIHVEADLES